NRLGSHVIEIDALQRLIHMKLSSLTLIIDSVPIENAISGVAVLLDLDQDVSAADGVKSPGRQENGVPVLRPDRVNTIGDSSRMKGVLELIARHRFSEANENFGIRFRRKNIPKFGLGFAA